MPLNWATQKTEILERVCEAGSYLRIMLKTKDDPFLLAAWIEHHSRIVPRSALIIIDNMSTDEKVLDFYDQIGSDILIFQYSGFHNDLHDHVLMDALYDAVYRSSDSLIFLDTDEFLVCVDPDASRWSLDVEVLLQDNPATSVFTSTWIYNVPRSSDTFYLGPSATNLNNGLIWGKPVVRNWPKGKAGTIGHNTQIPRECFAGPLSTRLFIKHMTQLYPEQRMVTNVNKLVARGFAKAGETAEEIVARGATEKDSYNIQLYVSELRQLIAQRGIEYAPSREIPLHSMRLQDSGIIEFNSKADQDALKYFVQNGDMIARDVLKL
jgi:hypothetical protein